MQQRDGCGIPDDRGGFDSTLLVVADGDKDGDPCGAFCPVCGHFGRVGIDESSNCLLWCDTHGEFLLCATGTRGAGGCGEGDVCRILAGTAPGGPCLAELSLRGVWIYAMWRGSHLQEVFDDGGRFPGEEDVLPGKRFFQTGALRITHFGRAVGAGDADADAALDAERVHWEAREPPARVLGDVSPGAVVHYRAACARCDARHAGYIRDD